MRDRAASSGKNLLVLGGADGMGNWLARRIFARRMDIARITLLDTNLLNPRHQGECERISVPVDSVKVAYATDGSLQILEHALLTPDSEIPDEIRTGEDLSRFDVVMVAVPEAEIERCVAAVFPSLRSGTWVFDICSAKGPALKAMLRHDATANPSIVGTHPLYGPAVADSVGQTVVLVKTESMEEAQYRWLRAVFQDEGALVVDEEADLHDRYMMYVQTLTHFVYLAFGRMMAGAVADDFDLGKSFTLGTPPYTNLLAFLCRIINAGPRINAQIQNESGATELRGRFVQAARQLAEELAGTDEEGKREVIAAITRPFAGKDVAFGNAISGATVEAAQSYNRVAYQHKKQQDLAVVKVIDTVGQRGAPTFHAGRLIDFDRGFLSMEERRVVRDGKFFIIIDDEDSERAFTRVAKGMAMPKSRVVRIHQKRARILNADETRLWRLEHLEHCFFDVPVVGDESRNYSEAAQLLTQIDSDVISTSVVDPRDAQRLSRNGLGIRNKILRVEVFGDRDAERCRSRVLQFLRVMGVHPDN